MNKPIIISIVILTLIGAAYFFTQNTNTKTSTSETSTVSGVQDVSDDMPTENTNNSFSGEKGTAITLVNNQVAIDTADFETNKIKYFNTTISDNKTVYYLILKDTEGNFRAAANGHSKCSKYNKGHTQEGDQITCSICKDSISVNDFALNDQKECTPKSISAKLPVQSGSVIITEDQLKLVSTLF